MAGLMEQILKAQLKAEEPTDYGTGWGAITKAMGESGTSMGNVIGQALGGLSAQDSTLARERQMSNLITPAIEQTDIGSASSIKNMYDSLNAKSPMLANKYIAKIKDLTSVVPTTKMQGSIPQGYRMAAEGHLELIPGSPQEAEAAGAEQAIKYRKSLAKRAIGVVQGNLKDALKFYNKAEGKDSDISDAVFGISGGAASFIPGTNRKSMEAVVETIRANIGFDRLQQMREASPTGGALGQVAVQELVALQATLGNLALDQEPEQFYKTVKEIQMHYSNMLQVIEGKMPKGANPLGI